MLNGAITPDLESRIQALAQQLARQMLATLTQGTAPRSMLSKVEVPDSIRKDWRFRIGTHGHFMLSSLAAISSLALGAIYCPVLLYRITQYYLGSQAYSAGEILGDFSDLTWWVAGAACVILMAAIAMVVNDIIISERYPTLVKVFTKGVLNIRATDKEVSILRPEAHILFDQGKYYESVLYIATALEYAMSSKLGISPQHRWRNLTDVVLQKMGKANAAKLQGISKIRNNAVHPDQTRLSRRRKPKKYWKPQVI